MTKKSGICDKAKVEGKNKTTGQHIFHPESNTGKGHGEKDSDYHAGIADVVVDDDDSSSNTYY